MVAKHNDGPNIVCIASALGEDQKWQPAFAGVAAHMQMSRPGIGLCAVWGINNTPKDISASPSAVFSTTDGGMSWDLAATLGTMLLVGAAVDESTALVGGTDGFLALVDKDGIKNQWVVDGGNVVAVDVKDVDQIAIIESSATPPVQSLLVRGGTGPWIRHGACFDDRVTCVKLLASGECIVCTRRVIYRCLWN